MVMPDYFQYVNLKEWYTNYSRTLVACDSKGLTQSVGDVGCQSHLSSKISWMVQLQYCTDNVSEYVK